MGGGGAEGLRLCAPARPVAPYVGGKRNLAGRLCRLIEATPHEVYAEPFVGMGGVFFRRRRAPRHEVINDLSSDVATLFRVLQRHYLAFVELIRFQVSARTEFDRLMATDPATLTDLERAARFLYLQRTAFGGKVEGRNFAMGSLASSSLWGRFGPADLAPLLAGVHARLAGVLIERLPFADFIARYDSAGSLFYCDPPYWGSEDYYGAALFSAADFERLAASLAGLKGRFILSINDVPAIRGLFARFAIEPVRHTFRISGAPTAARELIITGPAR